MVISKKGLKAILAVGGIFLVYKIINILWILLPFVIVHGTVPPDLSDVGIIGGADGPTAIYISSNLSGEFPFALFALLPRIAEILVFLLVVIFAIKAMRNDNSPSPPV